MTKPAKAKFSPVVHNRKVEEADTKSKEELTAPDCKFKKLIYRTLRTLSLRSLFDLIFLRNVERIERERVVQGKLDQPPHGVSKFSGQIEWNEGATCQLCLWVLGLNIESWSQAWRANYTVCMLCTKNHKKQQKGTLTTLCSV